MRRARLNIYQDCNDAFRNLLQGKFGKLPLGFPADWVYQSAFGSDWKSAMAARTEASPLESLAEVNLAAEEKACAEILKRKPNDEEFVLYLTIRQTRSRPSSSSPSSAIPTTCLCMYGSRV
jgi:hypothetical protein